MAGAKAKSGAGSDPSPVETEGVLEVLARGVELLGRGVVAVERIAVAVEAFQRQCAESGVPGSDFERAQRAIGRVNDVRSGVRLWRRVRYLLGPTERPVIFETLTKVCAGLAHLPAGTNAMDWARNTLSTVNERGAAENDARRDDAAKGIERDETKGRAR
jgi:hypothetical protein